VAVSPAKWHVTWRPNGGPSQAGGLSLVYDRTPAASLVKPLDRSEESDWPMEEDEEMTVLTALAELSPSTTTPARPRQSVLSDLSVIEDKTDLPTPELSVTPLERPDNVGPSPPVGSDVIRRRVLRSAGLDDDLLAVTLAEERWSERLGKSSTKKNLSWWVGR
jgi:hypothetical protein